MLLALTAAALLAVVGWLVTGGPDAPSRGLALPQQGPTEPLASGAEGVQDLAIGGGVSEGRTEAVREVEEPRTLYAMGFLTATVKPRGRLVPRPT
jgi:hypothetical protein